MEKYYLRNGKEVMIGDHLVNITKTIHPTYGECTTERGITVTKESIPYLVKAGIITPDKSVDLKGVNLSFFIEKIAERLGWKVEKVCNYLTTLDELHPAAAFTVVLREIAIHLDLQYPDHISNSPEIYVISLFDGRISKANKAHIRSYKNFAAFRSIEDAKTACYITRDILKEMFKNGK